MTGRSLSMLAGAGLLAAALGTAAQARDGYFDTLPLGMVPAAPAASAASGTSVALTADVGMQNNVLSGSGRFDKGGTAGGIVGFGSDLGLGPDQSVHVGLRADMGSFRIAGSLSPISFEGDGTFTSAILGQTFTGPVHTKLDLNYWNLSVGYKFFGGDGWSAGLGLGVHMYNFDITISGPVGATTQTENDSQLIPVPSLNLFASFDLGGISLEPEVQYMQTPKISDAKAKLFDVSCVARVHLTDSLTFGVRAGYNVFQPTLEQNEPGKDNTNIDATLASFQASLVVGLSF
jgi:hypothetical protein